VSRHNPERQQVDPGLAFLARAAAKLELVEAGLEDVDAAIVDLVHALRMMAPCPCERETLAFFERRDREIRQHRLRQWRWRRS
jgi:hypothetical protein